MSQRLPRVLRVAILHGLRRRTLDFGDFVKHLNAEAWKCPFPRGKKTGKTHTSLQGKWGYQNCWVTYWFLFEGCILLPQKYYIYVIQCVCLIAWYQRRKSWSKTVLDWLMIQKHWSWVINHQQSAGENKYLSLKLTARPWKSAETQKERIVFQPSIFRCELLVSGRVQPTTLNDASWEMVIIMAKKGRPCLSSSGFQSLCPGNGGIYANG